jgi:1,4-dihydroxy-2-naphthoate polyprenyltransferase
VKVLIIVGHPRPGSFCSSIADAYAGALAESGEHMVYRADLAQVNFDPHLRFPSPLMQPLEPGLLELKNTLISADHVVFVFPTWWGTMPAILKGFLDRVLLPGEAFDEQGENYHGLLKNKTGELITTMDAPGWVYRLIYRSPGVSAMKNAVLRFCGFTQVRATQFARVKHLNSWERGNCLAKTSRLASSVTGWRKRALRRALWLNWMKAIRLQFYPMTLIAFSLGALLMAGRNDVLKQTPFWFSYLTLFLIEIAAVFANEVVDLESDQRNRNFSLFTGGSRVLVDGGLTKTQVARGAWTVILFAACTGVVAIGSTAKPMQLTLLFLIALVLGVGYTVPPLRLVYRTLGEINVALTHSFLMVLAGAFSQPGTTPWELLLFLSTPMFLAVLGAITLAGIPDRDADAAVSKHTLAVAFGIGGSGAVAALACFLAAVCMTVFASGNNYPAIAPIVIAGAWCHCALILYLIATRVRCCQRITSVLALALSFILWSCVPQLATLLHRG